MNAFDAVFSALVRTSLQGALFIALVWLVCRLIPRLPAAVRCGLWWAACLKLLVGLVWTVPVPLPVLPASPAEASPSFIYRAQSSGPVSDSLPAPTRSTPYESEESAERFPWSAATTGLWLAGLLTGLTLTVREIRRSRGVVARSEPVRGWIAAAFADLGERLGLSRSPELRASAEVVTPQAVGLARPVVLLPAPGLERLSPGELQMTLCHELVHVRRGDLWLGWVPALAERLFFFHPLAALAAREYALAREAACDAEVLRVLGSAPQAYGRLLLRLGVAPRETGLAAAVASPSLHNLKRRLEMLQHTSQQKKRPSAWWWLAGAVALTGLVPYQMTAQEAAPEPPEPPAAVEAAAAPEAPAPAGAPTPAVAPAPPAPPAVPGSPAPAARPAVAPRPAKAPRPAPLPAMAPLPAAAPAAAPRAVKGPPPPPPAAPAPPKPPAPPAGLSWGGSEDDSFVLLLGDDMTIMDGSSRDVAKAKKLRDGKGDILWFERDGKAYVVRDAATLKAARNLLEPQARLGAKQGDLGGKQGELGAKQGDLAARQGALAAKQGALAVEHAQGGRDSAGLGKRQQELNDLQQELGRQQEQLARLQEELGRKQEELGRQQEEIYRKAEKELQALIDRALKSGVAQAVK